ncbi:hypothetical protein V9T40_005197 [Parthenolecanium corni]|uniref:Uncharacterized protein n=1 Tax=Parthenolecanium corni TaxID=536013 RepID=A0AAN9THG5_9HEMI
MDKLMSPEVRKHEELRKKLLHLRTALKRNLYPSYNLSTATATATSATSGATADNKKPPYRFFNRRSVNELTVDSTASSLMDLTCQETMPTKAELAQQPDDNDDQHAEDPLQAVAEIARPPPVPRAPRPTAVLGPSRDPVYPKWKDFGILGDFLAKSFFQGDAGNLKHNSADNQPYCYNLCGDETKLDNLVSRMMMLGHRFGRKFLVMLSGHELNQVDDKKTLVDKLKELMVELFERHNASLVIIAKPLPLPEHQEWNKVLLFDTFKAVGRLLQEKPRKNNLYFVCTDGTPRLVMSVGNFQTVACSKSDDQHLTWSTPAIRNASKQLSEKIKQFTSAAQAVRKPFKPNNNAVTAKSSGATSVAEVSSSSQHEYNPVGELNSISVFLEHEREDFLGVALINALDAVASICWSSDEEDDDENAYSSSVSSMIYVGATRAEIFCNDGSANSFVLKDFVERVIRENPTLKIISFPQKPVSYALGKPGKFMRNVDRNTMFPVKLTSTSGATFEFDLIAEMPQTFGHDIMFGRNVYSHLKINFDYNTSTMVFGVPELKDFRVPITIPFPTINEVSGEPA